MPLIIVESPTKSKTLQKFLGTEYKVLSSYGHMRDLPKNNFGIDLENDFEPKYVIIPRAKKNLELLKKEVKKTDSIILATDEDREGEAIAWHLVQALGLNKNKNYQRIVFHEITKTAIEEAIKNPRDIDINLVDAQQARRVLDRIVGYKLSPFLWKKVVRRLSAGRVQSVAVRFVVEQEREIEKFIPQEYWDITVKLKKLAEVKPLQTETEFEAILLKKNEKTIPKLGIKTKQETDEIIEELKETEYKIINIKKKEVKRNPLPPFTTSTLQQIAWQKFKWSAKSTMRIAQQLYEKGFITYHRTDSLNLSDQTLAAAKGFIKTCFNKSYWPGFSRKFLNKSKNAQEAHEAIRPAYPDKTLDKLKLKNSQQTKLYDLIWRRFMSCQMSQAIFDSTIVEIKAGNYIFKASGQILKFDGFLKVYPIKFKETELPILDKDEILKLIKLIPSQHFTTGPARYNEATLIKALEENGIGRPSTYAPILSNIQEKNYIEKDEQKRFKPTEIGLVVNDLLMAHFPEIIDIGFTTKMEENLDEIAQGQKIWKNVVKDFYLPFEKNLKQKYEEVSKKNIAEQETEQKCPICGANLLIKLGRFGKFLACPGFPKCKFAKALKENNLNIKCPKCETGQITEKRSKKRGKIFYGCDKYPKCDFALWDKPTGKFCPKCDSLLIETKRKQIKCSNPVCLLFLLLYFFLF